MQFVKKNIELIKVVEGVNEGVSEGVNLILDLLKTTPGLRSFQIAQKLSKPQKSIERWLKTLKDTHKIIFKGVPKTGGYFIIDN